MAKELVLPSWATLISPGKVEVDAGQFYPAILSELGVEDSAINQFWLEVAKSIMKMDIRVAVAGTEQAPEGQGALTILVRDDTKEGGVSKYAQKAYPEGDGAVAGANAARDHYRRLRGFVPV